MSADVTVCAAAGRATDRQSNTIVAAPNARFHIGVTNLNQFITSLPTWLFRSTRVDTFGNSASVMQKKRLPLASAAHARSSSAGLLRYDRAIGFHGTSETT